MIIMNKDGLIQKINTFEDARTQLNSTSYYVLVKDGRVVFSACYGIKKYYFHKYENNSKHVLAYLKWLKRYEKYETLSQQNLHRLPGPLIDINELFIIPASPKLKQICMAVNSKKPHPFIPCRFNQLGFAEENLETLVRIATYIDQLIHPVRTTENIIDSYLRSTP